VTIITALLAGMHWLPLANAVGLLGVVVLAWCFRKEHFPRWAKAGLWLLLVPLAFWVATYRPAGFSYPLVFSLPDATDVMPRYEFFANLGKGLCGFVLLYFLWVAPRKNEFIVAPKYQLLVALLAPVVVIAMAIFVLGLDVQVKIFEQIFLFALGNLLIISVAEEAFMRLLLQQPMCNAIACMTTNRWAQELAPLLLVTVIFVAIHSGLSGAAVWIYAVAGFLYGLSYTLSKNIAYPIAVHFMVNQIHFSFLTYPL
jgi:membrane protease YdiL (CAAX protease family)